MLMGKNLPSQLENLHQDASPKNRMRVAKMLPTAVKLWMIIMKMLQVLR